ncbi:MAG: oxidoreductase [Bacteroidetes bacterium]|nr:MAG: oxidoreductase [Bacteroidota bacterium]
MKTALVAGATGAIGKALLFQLIEDKQYLKVIALSRKPLTIKHHKLTNLIVDFSRLDNLVGQLAADDVYCCLGTTIKQAGSEEAFREVDHKYVVNVANACKQQGAAQFLLVTAMGANAESAIFYNRVKGETERDVFAIGYDTCVVVRPSLLIASRLEFRLGEAIAQRIMKVTRLLFSGPLKKYRAIEVERVAQAMIKAAHSSLKGNHILLNDKLFDK